MATLGRATTAATTTHPTKLALGAITGTFWAITVILWTIAFVDAFVVDILSFKEQNILLFAASCATVILTRWHLVGGETLCKAFLAGRDAEARVHEPHDVGHG